MPPRIFVVLVAMSGASPAIAQALSSPPPPAQAEAASTPLSPLTVEGKPDPKVIEKQTHAFVESYAATPNPVVDQIARWHEAICVSVLGLPNGAQAYAIRKRIEDAAQTVKLPPAKPGCRPNVEIVFTGQPQAMVDLIAKKHEELLGYGHRADRDKLKTVTHPIQAWYSTATQGEGHDDGHTFATYRDAVGKPMYVPTHGDKAEVADDPENAIPDFCGSGAPPTFQGKSRSALSTVGFTHCLTSKFGHVLVVADAAALKGKEVASLADYLVMLVLSQPRSLDGCNVLPSILDLFAKAACAGRDPPTGLTASDRAYIAALYASDPEALKEGEISDIAGRMAKVLIEASAGGK